MRLLAGILFAAVTVALVAAGGAASADFANGPAVARAMERHYNGDGFKKRLAKAGVKLIGRVLCAHDGLLEKVECTGHLVVKRKPVKAEWDLERRTTTRAKLSWTYSGSGVFGVDDEIVAPSAFGLKRF